MASYLAKQEKMTREEKRTNGDQGITRAPLLIMDVGSSTQYYYCSSNTYEAAVSMATAPRYIPQTN